MANLADFFLNTVVPIMILSLPLVVVAVMIIGQVRRNRNYITILKMDDGFRLYQEPNGSVLLRPRGWFTKTVFILAGALASVGFTLALFDPQITKPNDRLLYLVVLLGSIIFFITSVAYLRFGTIYFDMQQKAVVLRRTKTRYPFSTIKRLDVRDDNSTLRKLISGSPSTERCVIVMILKDGQEVELGGVTRFYPFQEDPGEKAAEIVSLLKAAITNAMKNPA